MKKTIVAIAATLTLTTSAIAFFNPFSMMGGMMSQAAAPMMSDMTRQMLDTMRGLLYNDTFRKDVARFGLAVADEGIYEMMKSMQGEEPTFIGVVAEVALTGGAEKGSDEYNQKMQFWMERFGPAMEYRMQQEQEQQAQSQQSSTPLVVSQTDITIPNIGPWDGNDQYTFTANGTPGDSVYLMYDKWSDGFHKNIKIGTIDQNGEFSKTIKLYGAQGIGLSGYDVPVRIDVVQL